MSAECHLPKTTSLVGQRFRFLVVQEAAGYVLSSGKNRSAWLCVCDCGGKKVVTGHELKRAEIRSCGCKKMRDRHGLSSYRHRHELYRTWSGMKNRCHSPTNIQFEDYGGRGISVCQRWRFGEDGVHPFLCFIADMGDRPSVDHSIDRIDNEQGYSPANCRWATRSQQGRNKRTTVTHEIEGVVKPICEWAEIFDLNYSGARSRVERGIPLSAPRLRAKRAKN